MRNPPQQGSRRGSQKQRRKGSRKGKTHSSHDSQSFEERRNPPKQGGRNHRKPKFEQGRRNRRQDDFEQDRRPRRQHDFEQDRKPRRQHEFERDRKPRRKQEFQPRKKWNNPSQGRKSRHRAPQVNIGSQPPIQEVMALYNRLGNVLGKISTFGEKHTKKEQSGWRPASEFSDTDDKIIVNVELPGVSFNDVNVSVSENQLIIKGDKRRQQKEESKNFGRSERRFGNFQRIFSLPSEVVVEDINAEFKDGVLTITVPKTDGAKPTDIPINAVE